MSILALHWPPPHLISVKKTLECAPDLRSIVQECGVTPGSSNATTCESSDWPHEIIFWLSRCQNCFARQSQTDPSSAESSLLSLWLASELLSCGWKPEAPTVNCRCSGSSGVLDLQVFITDWIQTADTRLAFQQTRKMVPWWCLSSGQLRYCSQKPDVAQKTFFPIYCDTNINNTDF